jgi:hypothetical protein
VEVPLGEHRADIVGSDGIVIELQNSAISSAEIIERERFYGKMVWLVNGGSFLGNFRVEVSPGGPRFHWVHSRSSWLRAKMPVFIHGFSLGRAVMTPFEKTGTTYPRWHELDQSQQLFQITSRRTRPFVHGGGRIISVERFIQKLICSDLQTPA